MLGNLFHFNEIQLVPSPWSPGPFRTADVEGGDASSCNSGVSSPPPAPFQEQHCQQLFRGFFYLQMHICLQRFRISGLFERHSAAQHGRAFFPWAPAHPSSRSPSCSFSCLPTHQSTHPPSHLSPHSFARLLSPGHTCPLVPPPAEPTPLPTHHPPNHPAPHPFTQLPISLSSHP